MACGSKVMLCIWRRSERNGVPWTPKTERNCYCYILSTAIKRFRPCIERNSSDSRQHKTVDDSIKYTIRRIKYGLFYDGKLPTWGLGEEPC